MNEAGNPEDQHKGTNDMKTLPLKRALMAGAALSLMILPVGAMAPAFAQEEEVAEEWSDEETVVEPEAEPEDEAATEAAAQEEVVEESPAETEAESDETGAVITSEAPAEEGAVPLSDEDGGSRAKSGPPT